MKKIIYIIGVVLLCLVLAILVMNELSITQSFKEIKQETTQIKLSFEDKPYSSENLKIIEAIKYPKEIKNNYKPIICLVEYTKEHRNLVLSVVEQFYKGEVLSFLDPKDAFTKNTPSNLQLHKCDIINYAVRMEGYVKNPDLLNERIEFLKEFKGIVVATAGNNPKLDVRDSQEFAYIKTIHPKLAHKIIIVSSSTIDDNGEITYANVSKGKEIDVVIPTENIVISANNYSYKAKVKGTSAATPAVTGLIALYLTEKGKTEAKLIKQAVLSSEQTIQVDSFSYPLIDATKMMKYEPEMTISK
jgi:hypothetical protein